MYPSNTVKKILPFLTSDCTPFKLLLKLQIIDNKLKEIKSKNALIKC